MNLIDEARAEELYADMGQAIEVSGGSAGNTAAGIASFGGKAAYFGKVKEDQLGAIFRHDMRAQGVSFDSPRRDRGPATARSFILVTPDGERTMNTYLGACVNLTVADIDPTIVEAAQVTYMEGYLWDRPEAKEAFKLAAADCAHGGAQDLDHALRFLLRRAPPRQFPRPDPQRASTSSSPTSRRSSRSTRRRTSMAPCRPSRKDCPIAVLTRSEKGCVVVRGEEVHAIPAYPVSKVVDVTGAGDLFAAGFLHGLTHGKPLPDCAQLGALAAAEVISHIGARPEVNLGAHAKAAGPAIASAGRRCG